AGGDLAGAAKALGLSMKTSAFLTRREGVEEFAGGSTIGDPAFNAEIGAVLGPIPAGEGFGVYKTLERQEADMSQLLDQQAQIKQEFLQAKQDETFTMFKTLVRKQYEDKGKVKRFPERIEALIRQIRAG